MSNHTLQLLESIRRRLRRTARRITLAELAYGVILVLGGLAAGWLVTAGVEAGLWLDPLPRTALAAAAGIVLAALFVYFVGRPLLHLLGVTDGLSEESVARRIGDRYPEVADRLVNLLHLSEGRGSSASGTLVDGAVRMLGEDVRDVSFEDVEDFEHARRVSRFAALPLLVLLVVLLAAPSTFLGATHRLLAPGEHFARPQPFSLEVTPGNVELVKGDSLHVRVRARGAELPRSITLQYNNAGEDHIENVTVTPDDDGAFRHTRINVRTPLRYRVKAAPVTTAWHRVNLTERPVLRDLHVTLDYPAYTGMPDQRLAPNVGDVAALPGTQVHVQAGLGGPHVDEALLVFDDGQRDTLNVDGSTAEGGFTLHREGAYHVRLQTADGVPNRAPIEYALKLVRDEVPSVALLTPGEYTALDESMRTGLRMRISDDFGFRQLRLYYRLSDSRFNDPMDEYAAIDLPLESPHQLDQEVVYDWLVTETSDLRLAPGDVVDYFIKVWDNDAVAGFKSAETPVHQLTLPSLADQYEQLDEQQDDTEEQLEEMVRESESMREQFEELRDDLQRTPESDWEDERQVESLKQQQERLQQQADDITRRIEEATQEMRRNDMVSEETLKLYEELQRVADEVSSPELQKALEQLQQSLQNMDPQMMQQAIEDFQFNEQQYQQRLERTLDLFKQVRVQQQLEEAARRAEELARQEQELAEQTEELRRDQGEDIPDRDEQDQPRGDDAESADDVPEGGEAEGDEGTSEDDERDAATDQSSDQNESDREPQDAASRDDETDQGDQPAGDESQDGQDAERREQLAEQQERSSEEMEALEEMVRELQEQMDELRSAPKQEMQQMRRQIDQQQLSRQMQQNSQQLQKNQLQEAQEGQQQMQQQLQQMQQQMQQMQQGMQGQQMEMNLAGLRRALTDVLTLSEQQEDLRGQVQGADSDNPSLRTFARRQVELSEGLSTVSDTLQRLAKDIPQMRRDVQQEAGESLRSMGTATEAMTDRNAGQAAGHQKESMMHLNELALMLSELLSNMQQNSGAGGGMSMQQMMQQMEQMSGQQQQLNEQIQQMLNDMQGNRLSTDQQKRLQQMARQQQQIRQQLQELSRNRNAKGEMLGDLQKIAEQMEETIEEMQQRHVDRRTIERQRQILTRLLQAQKSLRTQGEQEQREGQTGREYERERPGELTPSEEAERLRRALIRAIESGYAPDYEELIKRYFDLLQQQQDAAPPEEN